MTDVVGATVVIPTVGRPELLRACLESLARCEPRAEDIVVVNQGGGVAVEEVVAEFARYGARVCADDGRGRGRAVNAGLRSAQNDVVLLTDDDCTVARDWIGVARAMIAGAPGYIFVGRVMPVGDPLVVPSKVLDDRPRDYTGTRARGVLFGGNMVCSRSELLEFGGFDEDIVPSAEDNELCFRWLKARRGLRYEPSLVVWHHGWRTPKQLRELYRNYARGDGVFYGKELRAGELRVLTYVLSELRGAIRAYARTLLEPGQRWWDPRLAVLPWLLIGLVEGLIGRRARRHERRARRRSSPAR